MIVTFTANPSIDRTVSLAGTVRIGGVNRTSAALEQPGGKGINVAAALAANGVEVTAVTAFADERFAEVVADAGFPVGWALTAPVRMNLKVVSSNETTQFNEPGPDLDRMDDVTDFLLEVVLATKARWLVISGALPPGAQSDWYVQIAEAANDLGARVAVDASGDALRAVVERQAPVEFIKPNLAELAELVTGDPHAFDAASTDALVDAASSLVPAVREVVVSLGERGAFVVTADGVWHASAPTINVGSTVGAGDAFVAGYVWTFDQGMDPAERVAEAVRWGSAAASLPGTTAPVVLG